MGLGRACKERAGRRPRGPGGCHRAFVASLQLALVPWEPNSATVCILAGSCRQRAPAEACGLSIELA